VPLSSAVLSDPPHAVLAAAALPRLNFSSPNNSQYFFLLFAW
jgi:hypothetical protein